MTKKRKPINFSALEVAAGQPIEPIHKLQAKAEGKPPSRLNKVQIGAFVNKETRQRLKILGIQQNRSVNDIIEESFELLFNKYSK